MGGTGAGGSGEGLGAGAGAGASIGCGMGCGMGGGIGCGAGAGAGKVGEGGEAGGKENEVAVQPSEEWQPSVQVRGKVHQKPHFVSAH